ncbi:sulfatase [Acidobacteriota bacterium]
MLLAATVFLGGCQRSDKPNILLITLDATRADRLGCYGYPINTSPTIDRIAGKGVRFDFAIAQSATTPVSCASQLTGTYPYRHGLRSMHGLVRNRLGEEIPTLAEELQRLGYTTAGFVSAFPASSHYGLARGFDLFDEAFLEGDRKAQIYPDGRVNTGRSQRTAEETVQAVLPWLRQRGGKPFFAWIHLFDPHDTTFVPPQKVVSGFLRARPDQDKSEFLRSVYDAEIFFADLHIGQIVSELRRLGIFENTVIIITADHGEGLGDHQWWAHGLLYQEQIRVPLIMKGPGIPQGLVLDSIVEHVDIFPSVLELARPGSSGKIKGIHGQSLLPLFGGKARPDPEMKRMAYSEAHNVLAFADKEEARKWGVLYSLINDRWKLIHFPRDPSLDRLYNLSSDPGELKNEIGTNTEVAVKLLGELKKRKAIEDFTMDSTGLSEEEYKHLKALGYVQ